MTTGSPTVLLVHGALVDGSSWNEVIAGLQADGFPVLAWPIRVDASHAVALPQPGVVAEAVRLALRVGVPA